MKKTFYTFVVVLLLVLLTGCVVDTKLDLNNRDIMFDGFTLEWDSDENEMYEVYIDDNLKTPNKISNNKFSMGKMSSNFNVEVRVYIDDINKGSLPVKKFTYLKEVTSFSVSEDGAVSWNNVGGAQQYELILNGFSTHKLITPSFDEFLVGKNNFTIKPKGLDSSYFSYNSTNFSVDLLEQVKNINYDGEIITWDSVGNAETYEVYIDGKLEGESSSNSYVYNTLGRDISISVTATNSEETILNGAPSKTEKIVHLDTTSNVVISEGVLKWDEVPNATGYIVKYDNNEFKVDSNEFLGLPSGKEYNVVIKAISDDHKYFSNWSSSKTFNILQSPTIEWNSEFSNENPEAQTIIWDSVSAASGYQVKIKNLESNSETIEIITTLYYSGKYDSIGEYEVSVMALSEDNDRILTDSSYSNIIKVVRLASPNGEGTDIKSDAENLDEGFNIKFQPVVNASRYTLYLGGAKVTETTSNEMAIRNISEYSTFERQIHNYTLVSNGHVTNKNGQTIAYLDSLHDDSFSFQITILETPRVKPMEGIIFSWNIVDLAGGYNVKIGPEIYERTSTSFDLDIINPGTYDLSVSSKGNGENILPSKQSESQKLVRLDRPTNLNISTQEIGEGVLIYDPVPKALSYELDFNLSGDIQPHNFEDNISSKISTNGTVVTVRAIANYYEESTQIYYMSSPMSLSKQFTKLAAPVFPNRAFTNTSFNWLHAPNINPTVYTPNYRVYNHNKVMYNSGVNGNNMNISGFEADTYTFFVKAIGDGTKYINSDFSEGINVQKLETVNLEIKDNQYNWKGVNGALQYNIFIDGELVKDFNHIAGTAEYSYKPALNQLKDYTISVVAIGDNGLSKIDSEPYVFVQKTKMLRNPGFSFSYSHDQYVNDGVINVTVDIESPYANGYEYVIGGKTEVSKDSTFNLSPTGPGPYVISVSAIGGNFDEEGNYYIRSQSVGGNSEYTLYILHAPSLNSLELSADGRIQWGIVSDADRYEYTITFNDGAVISGTTTTNYFDIDLSGKTSVKFEIRVLSETKNKISSTVISKTYNLD